MYFELPAFAYDNMIYDEILDRRSGVITVFSHFVSKRTYQIIISRVTGPENN